MGQGDFRREHVLPRRVAKRAMDQRGAVMRDYFGKRMERRLLVVRQHRRGPFRRLCRNRIELLHAHRARHCPLVIARHPDGRELLQTRDAFPRLRTVADCIAHAPDGLEAFGRAQRGQHGFQRGKIRVDVRHDEDAHERQYTEGPFV